MQLWVYLQNARRQEIQISILAFSLTFYCSSLPVCGIYANRCSSGARPHVVTPQWDAKDCLIKYADVELKKELGRGNFGVVHLGALGGREVAVKKSLDDTKDNAFLEEARVMHILSHPYIVRFLGLCRDTPDGHVLIITEFMPNGDLLNYLHSPKGQHLTYQQLITIIDQVGTHCRSLTSRNHTLLWR